MIEITRSHTCLRFGARLLLRLRHHHLDAPVRDQLQQRHQDIQPVRDPGPHEREGERVEDRRQLSFEVAPDGRRQLRLRPGSVGATFA